MCTLNLKKLPKKMVEFKTETKSNYQARDFTYVSQCHSLSPFYSTPLGERKTKKGLGTRYTIHHHGLRRILRGKLPLEKLGRDRALAQEC